MTAIILVGIVSLRLSWRYCWRLRSSW